MITNEEIETVARAICAELGLEPERQMTLTEHDFSSISKRHRHYHKYGHHNTTAASGLCWQTFRGQAEVAIAAKRALDHIAADAVEKVF